MAKSGKAEKSALDITLDELFEVKKPAFNPFAGLFGWMKAFRPRMKKDQAFFGLLAAATEADGFVAEEERDELIAICHRTPFFDGHSSDELKRMHAALAPRLVKKKLADLTQHAARSVPKNLRISVFSHVLDLIMADRVVLQSERQFLERLQTLLEISDDDAGRIARIIKAKNAY
jgi:uncharacterized tellurite resistance protein B-like protein